MANFLSGKLPVITGALQGISSARGLDLARKLREQAALDELAVDKFRQQEQIKEGLFRETERQRFERDQALVTPQDRAGVLEAAGMFTEAGGELPPGFDVGSIVTQEGILEAFIPQTGALKFASEQSEAEAQVGLDAAEELRDISESEALVGQRRASAELSRTGAAENRAQADKILKETQFLGPKAPELTRAEKAQVDFNQDSIEKHVELKSAAFVQSSLD